MTNIFRFHTVRGVEELSKSELDKLSIATHPESNQSQWFKTLEGFCESKDFKGMITETLTFLKSPDAIHSIAQLDGKIKPIFDFVEHKGRIKSEKDRGELMQLIDLNGLQNYFQVQQAQPAISKFNSELQKIADTKLSLAILGKLGHKENMNYELLFKAFHLVKLVVDKQKNVSLAEITQLFNRTTTLPACFFRVNPCSQKLDTVQVQSPFSHLGTLDFSGTSNQSQILNVRGNDIDLNSTSDNYHLTPIGQQNGSCECDCDESCKGQNPCGATIRPFITDLMVVREELHCYKSEHLAYVETVMLGEERERVHRHLERTESYSEREKTTSKSEERDHQVSERFSLQTETQKTIESDLSIEAGVTASYWGPSYEVATSLNGSYQNSKSESQRVAREQAIDITDRTVRKIQESVRELNTEKRILETEETNTHSFKNADGTKHINGMYQFINAEYKGQVMNYGKRLMFEFVLPEPLEMYKALMSKEIAPFGLTEPAKPEISPNDIDENNYMTLAETYSVPDIPAPAEKFKTLSFSLGNSTVLNTDNEGLASNETVTIGTVPEGYTAKVLDVDFRLIDNHTDSGSAGSAHLYVAGNEIPHGFQTRSLAFSEGEQISGSLLSVGTVSVSGAGLVRCERNEAVYNNWKLEVYSKIMQKYEEDLNAYKAELARYNAAKAQKAKFGRNPFLNREIERTELKRMAISYISNQFYDQFTALKKNVKPCGYPQMDLVEAEKDGKFIQFFEQLFDWNLMTYLFYPYFWGQKCEWAKKVQEDSGDPLFDKALMAGAGRVQVPVKSGHEPLAMHWITFGEIWQGTDQPPVPGSPYYISMAQEIKEQKGVFYADREGVLEVTNGSSELKLTGSANYWNFEEEAIDELKIANDIDREIILDCVTYRIVDIQEDDTDATHETWKIFIERAYEGSSQTNLKWSTGALFVGAEFLITVPTNLVYLKNKKVDGVYVTEDCLPCFPQPKCE